MNYEDLKELVRYLKRLVKCSGCKKNFIDKDISVLATISHEGIFQLECSKCENIMLVNIGLKSGRQHRSLITKNDILDMHNFLEEFNGNFKELFKSSKQ